MPRPDVYDVQLMIGVNNRDSITEMAEKTGLSLAGVHQRLEFLEGKGRGIGEPLIHPPRKPGAARDRTLTSAGQDYLERSGHIPAPPVFRP